MAVKSSTASEASLAWQQSLKKLDQHIQRHPEQDVSGINFHCKKWHVENRFQKKCTHFKAKAASITRCTSLPAKLYKICEYPKSANEWLAAFMEPVSNVNPPLKLVVDLDETVIYKSKKAAGRFNEDVVLTLVYSDKIKEEMYYCDFNALWAVSDGQKRGHEVIIITAGTYELDELQIIFTAVNLKVTEKNFYNYEHLRGFGTKAAFINSKPEQFGRESLLIDDRPFNKPKHTHFLLANRRHFPLKQV